jgi:hypothetical protein
VSFKLDGLGGGTSVSDRVPARTVTVPDSAATTANTVAHISGRPVAVTQRLRAGGRATNGVDVLGLHDRMIGLARRREADTAARTELVRTMERFDLQETELFVRSDLFDIDAGAPRCGE